MSPQEVLGSLKDQTRGIWSDDPRATEKMQSFLEKDIYSHSRFRESAIKAQKEMEMRLDSRGDIVKRTILGDRTDFNEVKSRRAKSDLNTIDVESQKKKSKKPHFGSRAVSKEASGKHLITDNSTSILKLDLQKSDIEAGEKKVEMLNIDSTQQISQQQSQDFLFAHSVLHQRNSTRRLSEVQFLPVSYNQSTTFALTEDRIQRAAEKYSTNKQEWTQIFGTLRDKRRDFRTRRFSKDPSRVNVAQQSPFEISLIERTDSQFGYDSFGSKLLDQVGVPHICRNMVKPRDPADYVARKNAFYQGCHNSGVTFDAVSQKSPSIYATVVRKHDPSLEQIKSRTVMQRQKRTLEMAQEMRKNESVSSVTSNEG